MKEGDSLAREKLIKGNLKLVLSILKQDEKVTNGEYTFIIEKESKKEEKDFDMSIEAQLVDKMVNNNITLKEAVKLVNNENSSIPKKDIYSASLKLKDMF